MSAILPGCRATSATHWHFNNGQVITWNGSGQTALSQALACIDNLDQFARLVLFGAAGGLDPELTVGQLFACESVQYQQHTVKTGHLEGFADARQITVDEPVITREAREDLFQKTSASIADMESYFFADQMLSRSVKIAIIRFISDTATQPFKLPFPEQVKLELQKYRQKILDLY